MKYIKTYEHYGNINDDDEEPKVGDFIICEEEHMNDKEVTDFVNTHVSQIVKIYQESKNHPKEYIVRFENVPEELDIKYNIGYGTHKENYIHGMRKIYQREIIEWAKSKEELEAKIASNKYNL